MTTATAQATQVYQLFIKATPEAIWDAITKSEFTTRYFYASRVVVTPQRRQAFGPDGALWGDTAVLEFDPPRRWSTAGRGSTTPSSPRRPRAG